MTVHIVKVQLPFTSARDILVYNEDKSFLTFLPKSKSNQELLFPEGEMKVFGKMNRVDHQLEFLELVKDPGW